VVNFPLLMGRLIDLLKMDIEGGEGEILGDDRFERPDAGRQLSHARGKHLEDAQWCHRRLHSSGLPSTAQGML
jgi:hypothetical protein